MRKKFLIVLTALTMLFSLNSCNVYTYPTAQEDIYVETQANVVRSNVDFNVVMYYGTPYYYNGSILYYTYKDLYYYPFYYNNYWYVRTYRVPFNHLRYRPYFRPHRYDYRFVPGFHKGFDRPNVNRHNANRHNSNRHNNRFHNRKPDAIQNKSNKGYNRIPNRTHNRSGHFKGSRHI